MEAGFYRTKKRDRPSKPTGSYRFGLSTSARVPVTTIWPDSHEVWSYRTREPHNSLDTPQKALYDLNHNNLWRHPIDTGNPYWVKHNTVSQGIPVNARNLAGDNVFQGELYATPVAGSLPLGITSSGDGGVCSFENFPSEGTLIAAGSAAIRLTQPNSPNASVAQLLLELRRDLPKIPLKDLSKVLTLKDLRQMAGSEVLNSVFGWAPLIRDVQAYCVAVLRSAEVLGRFYEQHASAPRNWHSGPTTTLKRSLTSSTFNASPAPGTSINWTGSTANRVFIPGSAFSTTEQNTTYGWRFSGAYEYVLVEGSTFLDKMRRFEQDANVLLGTRITPELLWELAPWSWLIDWYAEIGNFIAVNSRLGQDGLVLQYGYLTALTTQRTLCTASITDQRGLRHTVKTLYVSSERRRLRALPYGFQVNSMANLNAPKILVLASIAISRDGKRIR
jgi:hypothetical protein